MALRYNNPAGRMLSILESAQEIGRQGQKVRNVWCNILKCSTDDPPELFRRLAELNSLLDAVELQLRDVKGDKAPVYLRAFPPIREAICPVSLEQNWNDANRRLDMAVLTALELCALELPEEGVVTKDELVSIRNSLDELYTKINESDLPQNLQAWLLDLISSAKRSIDLYEILG